MENGKFLRQMGNKIRVARLAKNWSYPTFSAKCGLNMSNLWFIEQGQVNAHLLTIKKIADALGMDIKELL